MLVGAREITDTRHPVLRRGTDAPVACNNHASYADGGARATERSPRPSQRRRPRRKRWRSRPTTPAADGPEVDVAEAPARLGKTLEVHAVDTDRR